MRLNDRDMLLDLLLTEKHLAQMAALAEAECANQGFRQELQRLHDELQEVHARLFHAAQKRGWYETPTAGRNAIEELLIRWEQRPEREPELKNSPGR